MRINLAEERRNHLHITVSIFKGITLGAAAYALLAILAANGTMDGRTEITALGFWLASFLVMMVTYDAQLLSSLITMTKTNVIDLVIPFVYGITEFSLFPILTPGLVPGRPTPTAGAALIHLSWWPLVITLLTFVAVVDLLNSQAALTATLNEVPPHLQDFIKKVKSRLRANQYSTAGTMIFYLAAFFAFRYGLPVVGGPDQVRQWQGLLGGFVILNGVFGIWTIKPPLSVDRG